MKKHFFSLLLCAVLFTVLLPAGAFAAGGTVTLTPRQDSAGVIVTLPQGADSGVTSLRLSFQVQLTGGDAEKTSAQFAFDGALAGSVHEYRYDAQTGRLNLYVSGRDRLFTDNTVSLGSVVLTTSDTAGAAASVSVVENSLELANAAYGSDKPGVEAQTVELTVGNSGQNPVPDDSSTSSSSSSSESSSSEPATSQPSGNTTGGGTTQTPSPSKGATGSSKPQASSSSVSESAENSGSQSTESSSASSSSTSTAISSSSASQSDAQPAEVVSPILYIVIGVLLLAILITAFVLFKRRR